MAYDASSSWWGFINKLFNQAYFQVTTKAGDATSGGAAALGNATPGIAYAPVMVLTNGVADTGPLGGSTTPLIVSQAGPGAAGAVDKGYQQAALSNSVASLVPSVAAAIAAGATYAIVEVEAANARWRADGTDPTATVGNPLLVGQQLVYSATDLATLKVIGMAVGSIVNVNYYK